MVSLFAEPLMSGDGEDLPKVATKHERDLGNLHHETPSFTKSWDFLPPKTHRCGSQNLRSQPVSPAHGGGLLLTGHLPNTHHLPSAEAVDETGS